jgi:hypothetical protein
VSSAECPFCGRELPRSFGTSAAFLTPHRTTRAGMYSHTAAASLLAAAACGGLAAGSNADAGDATVRDGESDAPDAGRDAFVPPQDGNMERLDLGEAGFDDADAGPCDSGPRERLDACGDVDCRGLGGCSLFECRIECNATPPYGKASIED